MSSSNPFKVSDLIAKYGWKIMPYLSNLGVTLLAEAQVLFVDSGATNKLDADDGYHGHSFETPLATIDYAIGLCTASEGAIILVAPGHNESLAAATIDFDVAGVTCIGLGEGTLRPRIDFDNAASSIDIGANNITLVNLTFLPSITDVLIGIDVEASKTNFKMTECEFLEGEEANDEFVVYVDFKSANNDSIIKGNIFRSLPAAAGCTTGIMLTAESSRIRIEDNVAVGNFSTAFIDDGAPCFSLLIKGNTIKVKDGEPAIELAATTTGIIANNLIESTGCSINDMIVAANCSWFDNKGVTTDGSTAEIIGGGEVYASLNTAITATPTAKSLLDILNKDGSLTYSKTSDSLEAISEAVALIDNTTNLNTAVSQTPTARSMMDILEKDADGHFDDATDSLEAISDKITSGTDTLSGINLDHMAKTADGGTNYPTQVTTNSILGMIISDDGDASGFNKTTDSLEAISDKITAITDNVTAAIDSAPTEKSLQDILHKDGTFDFDNTSDSLEAISDKVGAYSGDGGAAQDDSVKAALDLVQTDTTAILADTITISGGALPATATSNSLERFVAGGNTGLGSQLPANTSLYDAVAGINQVAISAAPVAKTIADILSSGAGCTYDKSTDSLEAISTALAAGTGVETVLETNNLDHLLKTTTGVAVDGELDSHVTALSVMGHIMAADADPSSYNCSTDSLGAIATALAAGTGVQTVLTTNNLDHLMKTTTGVAADSDLEDYVVAGTVLSHLMSVGADVTTFKPSTDSLEAISNKITIGTDTLSGIGLDHLALTACADTSDPVDMAEITDQSILANILDDGGDVSSYDRRNHSLVAIGDDTDAILADTAAIDPGAKRVVTATTTNWSLSSTNKMFTIAGGPVRARIWGVVTATIKNVAMNLKIIGTPTAPGGAIDIAANLDCQADAIGTVYKLNTTLGGAMIEVTGGVCSDDGIDVILPAGVTTLGAGAAEDGDGSITWYCQYEPLVAGATVTATP